MKKISISLILLMLSFFCKAQFTVTPSLSPSDLVQNHLLGSGVYADSITSAGSPYQTVIIQRQFMKEPAMQFQKQCM